MFCFWQSVCGSPSITAALLQVTRCKTPRRWWVMSTSWPRSDRAALSRTRTRRREPTNYTSAYISTVGYRTRPQGRRRGPAVTYAPRGDIFIRDSITPRWVIGPGSDVLIRSPAVLNIRSQFTLGTVLWSETINQALVELRCGVKVINWILFLNCKIQFNAFQGNFHSSIQLQCYKKGPKILLHLHLIYPTHYLVGSVKFTINWLEEWANQIPTNIVIECF